MLYLCLCTWVKRAVVTLMKNDAENISSILIYIFWFWFCSAIIEKFIFVFNAVLKILVWLFPSPFFVLLFLHITCYTWCIFVLIFIVLRISICMYFNILLCWLSGFLLVCFLCLFVWLVCFGFVFFLFSFLLAPTSLLVEI